MATVIRINSYRGVGHRDLPLSVGAGDSDLVPIALVLWVASLARVFLAVLHHETFGAEATFALMCAALLPWFVLRVRYHRDIDRT